jgi:predicted dehydrogenase
MTISNKKGVEMSKIKIGLIACGKIARCHHVPEMLKLANKAEITALYDVKKSAAKSLKKELSLDSKIYDSIDALLQSDVDAVIISTPNNSHCQFTMQAIKAGKHVLVEKPMAVNLKDADKMIAAAKAAKLHLQVNQSLRYIPTYIKIKELVDSGIIGEPMHIRCIRASASSPDKGWSPGAKWFITKEYAGGVVRDIAVHMADMMGWYFGDIASIYAITKILGKDCEVTDNVSAVMEFANGATGVLELSWSTIPGAAFLEIYGRKGAIRLGFDGGDIEVCTDGKKFKKRKARKARTSQAWFLDGIKGKPGIPCPEEIGRKALAYCEAILESGDKNKPVKPKI